MVKGKKMTSVHRRGQAPKFNGLVAALRSEILAGGLAPGTQLPTRDVLALRFGTTKVTVQKAMDILVEDGLVTASSGSGTFVAEQTVSRLPVVLVLAGRQHLGRSRFLEALGWEAARLSKEGHNVITCDVFGESGATQRRDLTQRILDHKLAGVIFADDLAAFLHTPILDEPHIPRVRLGEEQCGVPGLDMNTISHSFAFYEPVLEAFAQQGRRRVALLRNAQYSAELASDPFPVMAARFGLEVKPWWVQGVPAFDLPDHAERIAQVLMQGNAEHRPDALYIADDNLVPFATRGLRALGLRIPDELEVVAHANFPWPTECHVSARRIGSDVGSMLSRALDGIEALRGGRPLEKQEFPVQWEDDVAARHGSNKEGRPQPVK